MELIVLIVMFMSFAVLERQNVEMKATLKRIEEKLGIEAEPPKKKEKK